MDERLKHKLLLAKEHFDRREFDHAEPLLLQVLEKEPGLADVQNLLGITRHERGEFELARSAFEDAVRLNPNYTEALLNLVVTCNDLGDYDAAKIVYEEVRTSASGNKDGTARDPYALGKIANMHADLAQAYAQAGYIKEAISELEKAVALRPTFSDLHVKLGGLYRDHGDVASYAPAHVQLGVTFYTAGNLEGASSSFKEALRHNPADKIASMYLRLVEGRR
jgi:tetratricopeptide (TPR) repeat protein